MKEYFVCSEELNSEQMRLLGVEEDPRWFLYYLYEVLVPQLEKEGIVSYTALSCSLKPLQFQLEDWVSEETQNEINIAYLAFHSKQFQDDTKSKAIEQLCSWLVEDFSNNDWDAARSLFLHGECYYFKRKNEHLSLKEIRGCVRAAVRAHIQTLPTGKAFWLKANLPVGMY